MQDPIGIPACFSSSSPVEKVTVSPAAVTRSGQSVFMSVYRTKIADQSRLVTITWCKNLMLHGLSVSIEPPEQKGGGEEEEEQSRHRRHMSCKVELKPWYFWRKNGHKAFLLHGKPLHVFWDLKTAKFNGETEPISDYYVAVVSEDEVILLLGDLKKDAYRKTGCRPSLTDPILVARKEHIFGKKKFSTKVKFHEKGRLHEICIECKSRIRSSSNGGVEPEMEIRMDGHLVLHVKHLQWKFRGNEAIHVNKGGRVEVFWDVHDWLFCPGLRHALFIFKPTLPPQSLSTVSSPLLSSSSSSTPLSSQTGSTGSFERMSSSGLSEFCLFLYAWKMES